MAIINTLHLTGHTNSLLFRLNNKNHLVHVRTLQSGQVKHTTDRRLNSKWIFVQWLQVYCLSKIIMINLLTGTSPLALAKSIY